MSNLEKDGSPKSATAARDKGDFPPQTLLAALSGLRDRDGDALSDLYGEGARNTVVVFVDIEHRDAVLEPVEGVCKDADVDVILIETEPESAPRLDWARVIVDPPAEVASTFFSDRPMVAGSIFVFRPTGQLVAAFTDGKPVKESRLGTALADATGTEIGSAPAPGEKQEPKKRKWLRRSIWAVAITMAILVCTVLVLRVTMHGKALGERVSAMSEEIRGTMVVESVEWSLTDVPGALIGGWLPVEVKGLEVYDEFDDLVLKTDLATAEANIHALIPRGQEVVLRRIKVPNGGYAKIKQVREPYPESEFDHTVVSLISAFYPDQPPAFRAGLPATPGRIFDLLDYEVEAVTMEFDFPEFHAMVYGIEGKGSLRADASDPLAKKLYYSLTPTAPIGVLTVGGTYEVLTDIKIGRLALVPGNFPYESFPRDLEYQLTATGTGGAEINIEGAMLDLGVDFYGGEHDISLSINNASLTSKLIARDFSPESASDIEAESLGLRVTGPVVAPRVAMTVKDVKYAQPNPQGPPIELTLANAVASFDLATESGSLEDTIVRGLGGQVELAASLQLKPLKFDASLDISEPLQLREYLPPQVTKLVGSTLRGSLQAVGDKNIQRLEKIDIGLGRARVGGMAYRTRSGRISAEGLRVELDRTVARQIYGSVDMKTKAIDLHLRKVESSDLGRLLGRLGYPAVAQTLSGTVHVGGNLEDFHARGKLDFGGVPVVSEVVTNFSFGNQTLTIDSAAASGYGGSLVARGKVDLSGREPMLRGVTLTGRDLALDRLPAVGSAITGKGAITAEVSGPVAAPKGNVTATLSNWTVGGDRFADTKINASMTPGIGTRISTDIAREDGGRLVVNSGLDTRGNLIGNIELTKLPVAGILALAGMDTTVAGGTVSSRLDLSGTPDAPTAKGFVAATRAWLGEAFLGGLEFDMERIDEGVVQLRGKLLQGRVRFDGSVATTAPFAADLELRFHRVEADQFLPEMASKFGARGWISGSLSYRGDLVPSRRKPQIVARLTEVEALLDNEDARGRPAPIRLASLTPIEINYDGTNAALAAPAKFKMPGGTMTLAGELKGDAVELSVNGTVALKILRRYFADKFEDVAGELDVDVTVAGTLSEPRIKGSFGLRDVAIKPVGQDASVKVESGLIVVTEKAVATTGIEIVVADEFSDEAATLIVQATVQVDGFELGEWAVHAEGDLGGKMLLVFAPNVFSAANGRAELDLRLSGKGMEPIFSGELTFDEKESLTITPRGLRREIRLTGGSISLEGESIVFSEVSGWIDDEGRINRVDGEASLVGFQPTSFDFNFDARELPFRVPGVLVLSVNIADGRITGNLEPDTAREDRLTLLGKIEVVDGRYIERWSPFIDNLRPQRVTESEPPVWERVPILGHANLELKVASPAFHVRNNIADITMAGSVDITGTPLDLKLAGAIRVERGEFKIPGIRAKFTRTRGAVTFSEYGDFPNSTPTLDITSESDYLDLRGQNHLISMHFTGPLENISWDLSTANGLNRAQTLTLLLSGRTPADARRLFGDEAVGKRPGEYGSNLSTVDSEGTAAALDRVAKDLVGDQLDRILGDPIKNLTGFDVVRFEVGTASLGMHLEKNVTDSFRLLGDAERTLRGWTLNAAAQNRFSDNTSIEANALEKRFDDETLEDERDLTLRLTWRKVLLP